MRSFRAEPLQAELAKGTVNARLTASLEHGTRVQLDDLAVKALPPHVHTLYVHAFSNALHPMFLVGAVVSGIAFLLTWFLREVPLRRTTESAAVA